MAESTYPAPGVTQLQHERLLGRAMPSGVLGHPNDTPLVYAPGSGTREIRIRGDRQAVVKGYGWQNDSVELVKNLTANASSSTRTDLVVLRLSRSTWQVTVEIVQGTAGAGAPSPTQAMGASGVWEMPIATVVVPANSGATIASSAVTNVAWYLSEDGDILLRSTNRAWLPHAPFRMAGEVDTGRVIISTGSAWNNAIDDSGAVSITLDTGWSAKSNRVQRRGGTAVLALNVQRSTSLAADTSYKIGQLPSGFFPTFETPGSLNYESSAGLSMPVRVTATGGVWVDVPVSVTVNAARPLVGSLTFHTA